MRLFSLIIIISMFCLRHAFAFDISPNLIIKNPSFDGVNLYISGHKNSSDSIVISVEGPAENYKIIKRERVGLMWLNSHSLKVNDALSFHKLYSSKPTLTQNEQKRLKQLRIYNDERGMLGSIELNGGTKSEFYSSFIRTKILLGMYSEGLEQIEVVDHRFFKCNVYLPENITSGTYSVKKYIFDQKFKLLNYEEASFEVRQDGLYKLIKYYAAEKSMLYSFLCVIMALLIGGITSYVFNSFQRGKS